MKGNFLGEREMTIEELAQGLGKLKVQTQLRETMDLITPAVHTQFWNS